MRKTLNEVIHEGITIRVRCDKCGHGICFDTNPHGRYKTITCFGCGEETRIKVSIFTYSPSFLDHMGDEFTVSLPEFDENVLNTMRPLEFSHIEFSPPSVMPRRHIANDSRSASLIAARTLHISPQRHYWTDRGEFMPIAGHHYPVFVGHHYPVFLDSEDDEQGEEE